MAHKLPFAEPNHRRHAMITLLNFATLAIATMFAVAVAAGSTWIVLQVALAMMQPATAPRAEVRTELPRGTAQWARAFASNR